MSGSARRARVRALAKINLSLRVLGKRADGYHEIRTVFQTISLADTLEIVFEPGRRRVVDLDSDIDIADNLVERAARLAMERLRIRGRVSFRLAKRIPIGGGLGGGSSDAAAVLLALPVLAGRRADSGTLATMAGELGSDVPFFLLGGTALGLGRGAEVHPLPEAPSFGGLAVFPGVEIPTGEAYAALGRKLTNAFQSNNMSTFQSLCGSLAQGLAPETWADFGENDFEGFAFRRYPQLDRIRRRLLRLGARPVMMSGSGSSLFGIFADRDKLEQARLSFRGARTESFRLVSRARYHRWWWQALAGHLEAETWPPLSRYA